MPVTRRQLFVAEVKSRSPFGFESKHSKEKLIDTAISFGNWISVHIEGRFGGSFDDIKYVKSLTNKPILAKGFHYSDLDIKRSIDNGAEYVLVVGRVPAKFLRSRCIIEPLNILQFKSFIQEHPDGKYAWNSRNLDTGARKFETWDDARRIYNGWLMQCSFITTFSDVKRDANAFLVGENLVHYTQEMDLMRKIFNVND